MTVIGIDPGLATIGYGVVRKEGGRPQTIDYGVIRTEAGTPVGDRLCIIRDSVRELLKRFQPDMAAVERLLFSNNQKTVMEVSRASGVILMTLAEAGCVCTEYSPPEVKLAVTGEGGADKKQVQYMVRQLLNLDTAPKWDDAADALAIALCHLQRSGGTRVVGSAQTR